MSGGLRGTGQCPYSLAALSLWFSFLLVHPFPCDGLDFSLRKPRWRIWRLQLSVSALYQLCGVVSPFHLFLLLSSTELGGDRVREAGKRDGTKDAPKRVKNWCGTAGDIGEHAIVLACCFL